MAFDPGALEEIRNQINYQKPVMSLLVTCALSQHYVNLLGYNEKEQQILILDPNGQFYTQTYDWLKRVMYAGFRIDEGAQYAVYLPMAVDFDYYNIFIFDEVNRISDKTLDKAW